MAKFVIGQRVRIVRDNTGDTPEWVGRETFITGALGWYEVGPASTVGERYYGYMVDTHALGVGDYFEYGVCSEDELEPAVPDGMESPEESEKLWQPEGETA